MSTIVPLNTLTQDSSRGRSSRDIIHEQAAKELIFAVVGHVGSGTTTVAKFLGEQLSESALSSGAFDIVHLKAKCEIEEWARDRGHEVPASPESPGDKTLADARRFQDLGDMMREEHGDHAAVAKRLIRRIRAIRAQKQARPDANEHTDAVPPDGTRRAYILDAIRHPAEVHLLRSVYQTAFTLIGVVCEEQERIERIRDKFSDAGTVAAKDFMERDAKAPEEHGQRVSDAFHLADVFVDNSAKRPTSGGGSQSHFTLPDILKRLKEIIIHARVIRPTVAETAMYHAYGAQMRSACLSRQVGAALVGEDGQIIATGTNEAPKPGGGVYGGDEASGDGDNDRDARCIHRECKYQDDENNEQTQVGYCSNTREQKSIIGELVESLGEAGLFKDDLRAVAADVLGKSRIGGLLEFSRAVHAEMDALLTAGRRGSSTLGTRMFVTTFPCHYCARHLVSAGVDEVQYIEPYPKSQALALHDDAITTDIDSWTKPSQDERNGKVLFRPFTGIAPRMYRRAFLKDRKLKNPSTGFYEPGPPAWGTSWDLARISYVQLEAELCKED